MARVSKASFPPESRLHPRLPGAWFHDSWQARLNDVTLTPVQLTERVMRATPAPVEGLLWLRDVLVRPFGVRPVGRLNAKAPLGRAVGDRFGMFTIESSDPGELVMGIDDSHLDVRISCLVRRDPEGASYVVSSLVHTHNLLGQVYMLPVSIVHPLLVISLMRHLNA